MRISKKLSVIVIMTLAEVTITLWAAFQITKGATLHQLNSLHLKYNYIFAEQVIDIQQGADIDPTKLISILKDIRQQPIDCLAQVNFLDEFIMRQIGTHYALRLCESDAALANDTLTVVDDYIDGLYSKDQLIDMLSKSSYQFTENSSLFETPITKTVNFIISTMIPLVVVISLFNIVFIIYLARSIIGSINNTIGLLSGKKPIQQQIDKGLSKELYDLIVAATRKVEEDAINTRVKDRLEELVEQRTNSLLRANDELAQFAYRASHDLKAPLTSTKGLSRFIVQDIDDGALEEAKRNAVFIEKQMEKLEELVIGILSLTKAGDNDESSQVINLAHILSDITTRLEPLIQSHQCEIISEFQLKNPFSCQKTRLTQILENVLSNAIKYSDAQKPSRYVKISAKEDYKFVVLEIEDNGLGIPKERHSEMFQMFKRFHPKVSFGSGLGMAIVKKHVDAMNGKISFKSSAQGTQFTIRLPR